MAGCITCSVCRKECRLADNGQAGFCGGWASVEGKLENVSYGRLALVQREPVSLIPIMSWEGRSGALSFAAYGCSTRCVHCTNSKFAHLRPNPSRLLKLPVVAPEVLVSTAQKENLVLATDFVEPVNLLGYVKDVFDLAVIGKVPTILGTAGWLSTKSLKELLPLTTVLRLDLKGGTEAALMKQGFVGITPDDVLESARLALEFGVHTEITFCVIAEVNDFKTELDAVAKLVRSLVKSVPMTLIGHWKGGDRDPFPVTTDEQLDRVSKYLSVKLPGLPIYRMEV